MLKLDFSSVPSREPLEPGWYLANISAAEEKVSSTGKPMLVLTYSITATSDGEPVPGERRVFENLVLTQEALWKAKAVFQALGIDTSTIVDMDPDELIGSELMVRIAQDTYEGEIRNYAKGCKAIGA
jgi:hypothetical protein